MAAAVAGSWAQSVFKTMVPDNFAEGADDGRYVAEWIKPLLPAQALGYAMAAYLIPVALAWTRPSMFPRRSCPRWVVQSHNAILVAWSTYMSFGILFQCIPRGYTLFGNAFDPKQPAVSNFFYHFYISKLYEFMDTYIMLYRGKLDQVSFLHVYHHVGVFFTCWLIARVAPGGDPWLPTAANAGVHIIMYSYYFLCTMMPDPAQRKKYLWWGKYLTQLQIAQFVLYLVAGVGGIVFGTPYPVYITWLCTAYATGLLVLFSLFYMKRWSSPAKKAKKASDEVEAEIVVHAAGRGNGKKLA